jgi:hypothetical protein
MNFLSLPEAYMYEFFLGNVALGIEESLPDNGSLKGSHSLALSRLLESPGLSFLQERTQI